MPLATYSAEKKPAGSQYSDEELFEMAGIKRPATSDYSEYSDAELFEMAGVPPETEGGRFRGRGASGSWEQKPVTVGSLVSKILPDEMLFSPGTTLPIEAAKKGLTHGLTNLAANVGTGMRYVAGRTGSETLSKAGKTTEEFWDKKAEAHAPPADIKGAVVDKPSLLANPSWWAYNVAEMAPAFAASLVPAVGATKYIKIAGTAFKLTPTLIARLAKYGGSVVGGATGGGLEGASTYKEVLQRGGTEDDAARASEMMVLASGALNALSLGQIQKSGAWSSVKQFLLTGTTETGTEYLEEPAEVLIKRAMLPEDKFTEKEAVRQLAEGVNVLGPSFLLGGVGGGMGGAAKSDLSEMNQAGPRGGAGPRGHGPVNAGDLLGNIETSLYEGSTTPDQVRANLPDLEAVGISPADVEAVLAAFTKKPGEQVAVQREQPQGMTPVDAQEPNFTLKGTPYNPDAKTRAAMLLDEINPPDNILKLPAPQRVILRKTEPYIAGKEHPDVPVYILNSAKQPFKTVDGAQRQLNRDKYRGKGFTVVGYEGGYALGKNVPEGRGYKQATKTEKQETLLQWVKNRGGIWDTSLPGEIRQFGSREAGTVGLVRKQTRLPLDDLAATAVAEGWLPEGSDSTHFGEAIRQDIAGTQGQGQRFTKPTASGYDAVVEGQMAEGDRIAQEQGDAILDWQKKGFEYFGPDNRFPAGNLRPGDTAIINGEEYTHSGVNKDGEIVLKDGETIKADPFEVLSVEAVKRHQAEGVLARPSGGQVLRKPATADEVIAEAKKLRADPTVDQDEVNRIIIDAAGSKLNQARPVQNIADAEMPVPLTPSPQQEPVSLPSPMEQAPPSEMVEAERPFQYTPEQQAQLDTAVQRTEAEGIIHEDDKINDISRKRLGELVAEGNESEAIRHVEEGLKANKNPGAMLAAVRNELAAEHMRYPKGSEERARVIENLKAILPKLEAIIQGKTEQVVPAVARPGKQAVETKVKEPWMMTRDEFEPMGENGAKRSILLKDGTAIVGGNIHGETYNMAVDYGFNEDLVGNGMSGFTKPDGTTWDLQGKLYKASKVIDLDHIRHKNAIKQALLEDKPVPTKVLADYPDLKPSTQGESVPEAVTQGDPTTAGLTAKTIRFEAGKKLTKEQKKEVIRSLGDAYKDNDAPREFKGIDQRTGEERYGYAYSPDSMYTSDITRQKIRHYIVLPDGRKAHPSEIFPDITQSEIDAEIAHRKHQEATLDRLEKGILKGGYASVAEANRAWRKANWSPMRDEGTNEKIFSQGTVISKDGKHFRLRKGSDDFNALVDRGWKEVEGQPRQKAAEVVPAVAKPKTLGDEIRQAITDKPAPRVSPYETRLSEADGQDIIIESPGERLKLENAILEDLTNPTGELLGGTVTQISGDRIGEGVFEIKRPYGTLRYDEASGGLSVTRKPILDAMKTGEREVSFGVDKTLLLQTVSKDIVNNDLAGTIANETIQNALDAFPAKQKNKTIQVSIATAWSGDVMETQVTVEDNGSGMSQNDVVKKLLRLGAKGKEGSVSRGGYGLAKAGFLLTPRRAVVVTVKDGQRTELAGTKEQFFGVQGAGKATIKTTETNDPNGTKLQLYFHAYEDTAKAENAFALPSYNAISAFEKYIDTGVKISGVTLEYQDPRNQTRIVTAKGPEELDQVFPSLSVSVSGSNAKIYFVKLGAGDQTIKGWRGEYNPRIETFNKGLALFGIRSSSYNLTGLNEEPTFKVVVNFEKTPDVRAVDYPFIRNRTELNYEVSNKIAEIINEKIQRISKESFEINKRDFLDMIEKSPEVAGIKILIPFKDAGEFSQAKDLIEQKGELVKGLADIFQSFQAILKKIGGKQLNLAMTVDPKVYGYRSNPDVIGHEIYAINPFAVTGALEVNPVFQELLNTGYDAQTAKASNLVHTLVHEYTHNTTQDHTERFALDLAGNYLKMTHTLLARLEQQARRFYESHGDDLGRLQADFAGMGKGGSRFSQSDLAVHPTGEQPARIGSGQGIQETSQEVGPPQDAIDRLKNQRGSFSLRRETGRPWSPMDDLVKVGKYLIEQGHDTLTKFRAALKETLGKAWESVRGLSIRAYRRAAKLVRDERGAIGRDITEKGRKYNRRAMLKFGTTEVDESIGYITRTGQGIDSSGRRLGSSSEGRNIDHRQIAQTGLGEDSTNEWSKDMRTFMNETGDIRIVGAKGELNIDVPIKVGMPTTKQIERLRKMATEKNVAYDLTDEAGISIASGEGSFQKFVGGLSKAVKENAAIKADMQAGNLPKQLQPMVDFTLKNKLTKEQFRDARFNEKNPLFQEYRREMDKTGVGVNLAWSDFGFSHEGEFYDRVAKDHPELVSSVRKGLLKDERGAIGKDINQGRTGPKAADILAKLEKLYTPKGAISSNKTLRMIEKYEDVVQALRDSAKDVTEKQKILTQHIKDKLPQQYRGRMLPWVQKISQPKTDKGRETQMRKALEALDATWQEIAKGEALSGMKDLLSKAADVKKNGVLHGKIDPIAKREVSEVLRAVELTRAEALTEQAEIFNKIDREQREPDMEEMVQIWTLNTFGGLKELPGDKMLEAKEALKQLLKEGRARLRSEIKAQQERRKGIREQVIDLFSGGKGAKSRPTVALENARKGLRQRLAKDLAEFDDMHQSFEMLLDKYSRLRKGEAAFENPITEYFVRMVHEATDSEKAGSTKVFDKVQQKARELFGTKHLEKTLLENATPEEKSGVILDDQEIALSQNQAYKIWQWWQDATLHESMENDGYTAETMEQIEDFMTPEIKAWARWQLDVFYPEYYPTINEVYKKLFYTDMGSTDQYSPVRREYIRAQEEDPLLGSQQTHYASVTPGGAKARVKTKRAFRIVDGDTLLAQHITEMEHFKAWGIPMRELRSVLGHEDVSRIINQYHGGTRAMTHFLNSFASNGIDRAHVIKGLDYIRRSFTMSKLPANVVIFLKQLTAAPAAIGEIGPTAFIKGFADLAKHPLRAYNVLRESKMWQGRYRFGQERDIALAIQKSTQKRIAGTTKLVEKLMLPTKLGDAGAVLSSGWPVYRHYYQKLLKETGDSAKAHNEAIHQFERVTKRWQQSADQMDLARYQTLNSTTRLFTMFMSAQTSYYRNAEMALRNLKAGRGSRIDNLQRFATAWFILPMFFQYVASGFDWDDDDQIRAALLGPLNGIFVVRDLLDATVNAIVTGKVYRSSGAPPPMTIGSHVAETFAQLHKMIVNGDWDMEAWLTFVDKFAIAASEGMGVPYEPIKRLITGIKAAIEGETKSPVRRALGFSEKVVEEDDEARGEVARFKHIKGDIYQKYRTYYIRKMAYRSGPPDEEERRELMDEMKEIRKKYRGFNKSLKDNAIDKHEVPRITGVSLRRQARRLKRTSRKDGT